MAMPLVQFPEEYDKDISVRIFDGLAEQPNYYMDLFNISVVEDLNTNTTGYSGFGSMGQWPDGEPMPMDEAVSVFDSTITQEFYGMGFAITRKHLPHSMGGYGTGQLRLIQGWADALARGVMQTYNTLGAAIFNNAFSTTYASLGTVALCSASHVTADGSNDRSNILASSALTPANLETVIVLGANNTNYRGLRDPISYSKLVTGPSLRRTVAKILKSEGEMNTANNDANTQRDMFRPVMNPFISSTTAWFLQSETHGLPLLVGLPPQRKRFQDDDTETLVHGIATDFKFGVEFFEGVAGSQGA